MKQINNRMTFSSFGGFFAGPPRCATAIVREDDNTGPGGACEKLAAEAAQLTIKAGKEIVRDIEQAMLRLVGVKVVLYPLREMQWEDAENKDDPNPVAAAMAWHYAHALNYMEALYALCGQGQIFAAGVVFRTLMEVTHNGVWIVHPGGNSMKRAGVFWDYARVSEEVVRANQFAHLRTTKAGGNVAKIRFRTVNSFKREMKEFGNDVYWISFRQKLESMGVVKNYWIYYQPLSDVTHGKGPWGAPHTDGGEDALLGASCEFFWNLAEKTLKSCGISNKFQPAFGIAIRKYRERQRAAKSDADHGEG